MKNKIVKWDYKLKVNNNQSTEDEDIWKITQKTRKKFKSIVEWFSTNKLLARCPTILTGWMFIACFFYPGIDMNEVFKSRHAFIVGPILTIFWLFIVFREQNKYKRLYNQVCDWTIIIKKPKIIEFKRYGLWGEKNRDKRGYRIIAWDWEKTYKSIRFSDCYLWINYSNEIYKTHFDIDELKINGKVYHIWDKVAVYIDCEREKNYYLDI